MGMDEIVVGLDIGSGKVCTVVGELSADDQIEIIAIGTSPSLGIKKGIIIDLEQAIQSADRKSTRLNSSHKDTSRMPSSA